MSEHGSACLSLKRGTRKNKTNTPPLFTEIISKMPRPIVRLNDRIATALQKAVVKSPPAPWEQREQPDMGPHAGSTPKKWKAQEQQRMRRRLNQLKKYDDGLMGKVKNLGVFPSDDEWTWVHTVVGEERWWEQHHGKQKEVVVEKEEVKEEEEVVDKVEEEEEEVDMEADEDVEQEALLQEVLREMAADPY